uniref:anthocyanidin 3-O-glucosyltransferase 2-like n=1 Tax=Erigeron canadensis TaxID=72917 RepID=UPI001CB8AC9E|nr:anthocyanidin 3-O-glucosyltransferase 2-like [Erigeron canadensis]
MEPLELLFIPAPLMGHIGQAIELANILTNHFNHITITVLIMQLPIDPIGTNYTKSLSSTTSSDRIKFIQLPPLPLDLFTGYTSTGELRDMVLEKNKPQVRDILSKRLNEPNLTPRLAACVVSMFTTTLMEVVNEFNLPTYVFFASNAAYLGTMLYLQNLQDEHGLDVPNLAKSETEFMIPSYINPVPTKLMSFPIADPHSWKTRTLLYARRYRQAKGIIVNTFMDLEKHPLLSYDNKTPPVYAVGPMIKPEPSPPDNEILNWLKCQPKSSVVLLCFGSRGWFTENQVKEIAFGIEKSGYKFIWSLRRPPTEGLKGFPGEYMDFNEVLPDGFLERTYGRGKVIGWVPQQAVLSNEAIGGFVTHCGWNSVLESIWYGVPMATWPIYAEQQLDAFQLVKELGLAVEISLDYNERNENQELVRAQDIENGIRKLMDGNINNKIRSKVLEMKNVSRMALQEGGPSFTSLKRLVDGFAS